MKSLWSRILPLTPSQSSTGLPLPHPAHVCEYWHDGPCPFLETEARLTVANRKQKTLPQGRLPHRHVGILLQIAVLWVVALAIFLDVVAYCSPVATSISHVPLSARVDLLLALGHAGNEGLEFV